MSIPVVIAFSDRGCPHRRASFELVRACYQAAGLEVLVDDGEPFTKAAVGNRLVARTDADVIVQSDPDVLVPLETLLEAIRMAGEADGLVSPFHRYLYVGLEATSEILAGRRPAFDVELEECDDWGVESVGGVAVFSRATWEAAGGFDERFGMWGGDDRAFAFASELAGPNRRLEGDMVHLWHPRLPESIEGHPEHTRSAELGREWREAASGGARGLAAYVALNRSVSL